MSKRFSSKIAASFIEPMLCLCTSSLPEGEGWEYELKLDGYRAVAIKMGGSVQLRSRNDKDFTTRFPLIVMGLSALPSETVIDGELVAFDESGRPSFNALQNYASAHRIFYYAFDLLILEGRDLRARPLSERRELLRSKVLMRLSEPIRYSPTLEGKLGDLIAWVRQQKIEGLIAKRADSAYESGDVHARGNRRLHGRRRDFRRAESWLLQERKTAVCFPDRLNGNPKCVNDEPRLTEVVCLSRNASLGD